MGKMKFCVICGGQSAEHAISIISAKNVIAAIDKEKYDICVVYITHQGKWFLFKNYQDFLSAQEPEAVLLEAARQVTLVLGETEEQLLILDTKETKTIDVAFPVLHGPNGEDGTIQGLLEFSHVPFIGADALGSAVAMDKSVTRRLLREADIPTPRSITVRRGEAIDFETVCNHFSSPFFVKPANLGSSIGITKVSQSEAFGDAVALAFKFDKKIVIEEAIDGRELEVSVLGNGKLDVSLPGEIIPSDDFYTYNAKYIDEEGAKLVMPVELASDAVESIKRLAEKTFKALCCEGMARVDFFLTKDGKLFVNEINTIPGFTDISMYPKLWELSGLPTPVLLDRLVDLAIERSKISQACKQAAETFAP